MPTLFVIGYVWPEPNSSAAGSRMVQLLRLFKDAGYRIIYGSAAEPSQHAIELSSIGVEAVTLVLNCSSFDDYIRHLQPDVVMFDRFMMEEQFGWRVETHCPNALRVLDSEDLHSLRHARHVAFKAGEPVSNQYLHNELAKREVAAILRCDLSLMISEAEIALLTNHFKVESALLHYTPFMLDADQHPDVLTFAQRQHFVSIGNFRHAPNWDAVLYLKESIWPLIRARLPDAQLHIYGAYPPPKATLLHNERQGFLVKGWAENALAVVGNARVLLAPLRFGAGLKGKLIDAALCHTPAVTTTIGAEGLYAELPSGLVVTDEPQAFAQAAVNLYTDAGQWQKHSNNAAQLIASRFNAAQHGPCLLERIETLKAGLDQHRLDNFHGAMLRHHRLKSTQYMAQWIEAKNKLKASDENQN
ncbi:glycosyltransferase family 4 protein [Aliiglaciecola sp. CAU 1673]|uniref:glycosyltransferase n=1 Tax=Aliiglaciecola sp. CAU 1673 TaxID=3032595 RepID=UPI0023DBBE1B|nr:glycosyltransferase family 4 protein [Aliiglaciecola sp. CAU 1673]MDF2180223.1 glycosyltransferase family 4 protein [Aliiglaciecola sp. CAU 1673]